MAESDNNTSGGVSDPLKMRNTETAVLKRIPASPNSASASSAARKTIKLKPLMPSASGASGGSVGTETRSVAPPSILVNMRKPAVAPAEAPPKFMSTNTAPIGKMAKPEAEKPIPAASLQTEPAPTKTVSIPRLQARASKVAPSAPAASAPAPSGTPPVSTVTAPVTKIVKPAAPAAAAGTPPGSTVTAPVPKIVKPAAPAAAAGTSPVSTVTAAVPKIVRPAAPAAAAGTSPVSTTTQGIQKQAIDQAKMQSGMQGAKPAIKLRPSASPTQDPSVLTPASPTIKLAPKTESAVSPVPPADSEAPAADAENPGDVTVTAKIPRKTLQLKPKLPPSSGAQLREQGDIANQHINSGVDEGEQTIQQSVDLEKKNDASGKNVPLNGSAADSGKSEPNIIFTICAILALLVIGYMVFSLATQFLNLWQGQ